MKAEYPPLDAQQQEQKALLVKLLRSAAELEHCLLNSYLFTACSLKSAPWEFGPQSDPRQALRFERVRGWKRTLLNVAHEEMIHLHYVQCMLRALGEQPHFGLPARDEANQNWMIPSWQPRSADGRVEGAQISVARLDQRVARRLVLYEATDALQDSDLNSAANRELFQRLLRFEQRLLRACVLTSATKEERPGLEAFVDQVLQEMPTLELASGLKRDANAEGAARAVSFQSITDLYKLGIEPLYQQAFQRGWVKYHNLQLNYEMLDEQYAEEGTLGVGPVFRSANSARQDKRNEQASLHNFRRVEDLITEIVEEGEGVTAFRQRAEAMLARVETEEGLEAFRQAMSADAEKKKDPEYQTPAWLQEDQNLRLSHLYRFAMMLTELEQEQRAGDGFDPAREPLEPGEGDVLQKLAQELPAQFNACYLTMLSWLARIYEIRNWQADKPRRQAIEMLATWPLMSLALRPLLELCSMLPVAVGELYRLEEACLPELPVMARDLLTLYRQRHVEGEHIDAEALEKLNHYMDELALATLDGVARWASSQYLSVQALQMSAREEQQPESKPRERQLTMLLARLQGLQGLSEFAAQFGFRAAGGYSNRLPDAVYQQHHRHEKDFSENPAIDADMPQAIFAADTMVLRLRFQGWAGLQLATDPDPPVDESGVSGTLMLRAADGEDARFNRALIWQDCGEVNQAPVIRREPRADLPELGVNCVAAALLMAVKKDVNKGVQGGAWAGYVPIGMMDSHGAVQANGVQSKLQVEGLQLLHDLPAPQAQVHLAAKDGVSPFYNGDNHLVSRDGEPIDPFILAIHQRQEDGRLGPRLLAREVFNEGKTLLQMRPLARALTSRWPCGFDGVANLPDWALQSAKPPLQLDFSEHAATRQQALLQQLSQPAQQQPARRGEAVSYIYRLSQLNDAPAMGKLGAWWQTLLHYGHSISGEMQSQAGWRACLLAGLESQLGVELDLQAQPQRQPDSLRGVRWLVDYTMGMMDTDALRHLVYGELHIPLTIVRVTGPCRLERGWELPSANPQALARQAEALVSALAALPGAPEVQSGEPVDSASASARAIVSALAAPTPQLRLRLQADGDAVAERIQLLSWFSAASGVVEAALTQWSQPQSAV